MFSWISLENPVAIWWIAISTAGVINILFWTWTRLYRFQNSNFFDLFKNPQNPNNIIWYSMLYVFVCAFRSWIPRADVQRICLWDTWFSSVMVGRSVATIAELAFVFQWTLVLRFYASTTKDSVINQVSKLIFPLICVAEICSWYAVIRTHYLGNSIEESLWAVSYFLIAIALFRLSKYLNNAMKMASYFGAIGSVLYVIFMMTVDVPMYITRLIADTQNQKEYFGFWDGLIDLNQRWVVTHNIIDWKSEIPWQTLYFTFAVMVSIALCYLPINSKNNKSRA